jgi:hypothetical protein
LTTDELFIAENGYQQVKKVREDHGRGQQQHDLYIRASVPESYIP